MIYASPKWRTSSSAKQPAARLATRSKDLVAKQYGYENAPKMGDRHPTQSDPA